MPEYTFQELMIAKQIAELLMDRIIDNKVLKQINKEIVKFGGVMGMRSAHRVRSAPG